MEHGLPEVFAGKYGMSLEEAKAVTRKEYETVGDGRLEWYDIEYWLDRFSLTVSSGELLNRYESYIELLPFAREVLEELQEKYILVIASNAARIFVEKEVLHDRHRPSLHYHRLGYQRLQDRKKGRPVLQEAP